MLPRPAALLSLTVLAGLLLPARAAPQMVVIETYALLIYGTGGVVATMNDLGDLSLGGHGRNGDLTLLDTVGTETVKLSGGNGNITLGGGADDGDLFLRDNDGTTNTIHLDGQAGSLRLGDTGSVQSGLLEIHDNDGVNMVKLRGDTGDIYATQIGASGLVKAWARIGEDGAVLSCWRCSLVTDQTKRIDEGEYQVEFVLIGNDSNVASRPFVCSVATGNVDETFNALRYVTCTGKQDDDSKIYVRTWRYVPAGAELIDTEFTLVVF